MTTATLSYSAPLAKPSLPARPPRPQAAASRKGILARFFDAMVEARMRQAMRELAMHRHLMPETASRSTANGSAGASWC